MMTSFVCLLLLLTIALQCQAFISSAGLLKQSKWLSSTTRGSTAADGSADLEKTVVYVGNLPWSIMEPELINLAKTKGVTGNAVARVEKNIKTSKSRGFGYLEFNNKADAEDALTKLSGLTIEGRVLKVDLDYGREKRTIVDRSVQWNNGANRS